MLKWFDANWPAIEPILPALRLLDENNAVINFDRERMEIARNPHDGRTDKCLSLLYRLAKFLLMSPIGAEGQCEILPLRLEMGQFFLSVNAAPNQARSSSKRRYFLSQFSIICNIQIVDRTIRTTKRYQ
jgi:hypothetical protein